MLKIREHVRGHSGRQGKGKSPGISQISDLAKNTRLTLPLFYLGTWKKKSKTHQAIFSWERQGKAINYAFKQIFYVNLFPKWKSPQYLDIYSPWTAMPRTLDPTSLLQPTSLILFSFPSYCIARRAFSEPQMALDSEGAVAEMTCSPRVSQSSSRYPQRGHTWASFCINSALHETQ